jgi:hypothetical protein
MSSPVEPWSEPIPLLPGVTSIPFSVDALPGLCGDYVEAVEEATQTPIAMAGTFLLGTLSGLVAGRCDVRKDAGWSTVADDRSQPHDEPRVSLPPFGGHRNRRHNAPGVPHDNEEREEQATRKSSGKIHE